MQKRIHLKNIKEISNVTKIFIDRSQKELLKNMKHPEKDSFSYPIFLWRTSDGIPYSQLYNLSNTQHIDFFENTTNGIEQFTLPTKIKDKIAEFLKDEPYLNFECHEFIHFITDKSLKLPLNQYWKYEALKTSTLEAWNIVDLVDWGKSAHMAMYLSDWLYLSKAGKKWRLVIMSLEEMQKFFGGNEVFKLT